MRKGREIGPVFRHGDRRNAKGRAFNLLLRRELDLLLAWMRTTGQRFGRFRRTLADGSRIAVSVNLNGPTPQFIVRAVAPPVVAPILTPQAHIELENGLLLVLYSAGDFVLPFNVATGTDLRDYFGAGELNICCPPTELTYDVVQGKSGSADVASDCTACFDFSESAKPGDLVWPLDAEDRYASHIYKEDPSTTVQKTLDEIRLEYELVHDVWGMASMFTGLMRLMVQALTGAGRYLIEICPDGVPDYSDGIHLDDNFDVWYVHITGGAVKFTKLRVPEEMLGLQQALKDWTGADTARDWYLTLFFSRLEAGDTTITVTPEGLADHVTYGAPIAWGWKHSRGSRRASVVLLTQYDDGATPTPNTWHGSKQLTLEFDFTGAVPTASFTLDQDEVEFKIAPQYFNLWVPLPRVLGPGYLQIYDTVSTNPATYDPWAGNVGALYCYYDINDTLQVLKYTSPTIVNYAWGDVTDTGSYLVCASGSSEYEQFQGYADGGSRVRGGFTVPEFDMPYNEGRGHYYHRHHWFEITEGEAPPIRYDRSNYFESLVPVCGHIDGPYATGSLQACERSCSSDPSVTYDNWITDVWADIGRFYGAHYNGLVTGGGQATYKSETARGRVWDQVVIIPQSDAESLYAAFLDNGTTLDRVSNKYYHSHHANRPILNYVQVVVAVGGFDENDQAQDVRVYYAPQGIGWGGKWGGGTTGNSAFTTYYVGSLSECDVCHSATDYSQETRTAFVSPHGPEETSQLRIDWDWFTWGGYYDLSRNTEFDARIGFQGTLNYYTAPEGSHQLDEGFGDVSVMPGDQRWMGNV